MKDKKQRGSSKKRVSWGPRSSSIISYTEDPEDPIICSDDSDHVASKPVSRPVQVHAASAQKSKENAHAFILVESSHSIDVLHSESAAARSTIHKK